MPVYLVTSIFGAYWHHTIMCTQDHMKLSVYFFKKSLSYGCQYVYVCVNPEVINNPNPTRPPFPNNFTFNIHSINRNSEIQPEITQLWV